MVTPYGTDDEDSNNNDTADVLELKIDSQLEESGIVESFVFDIEVD